MSISNGDVSFWSEKCYKGEFGFSSLDHLSARAVHNEVPDRCTPQDGSQGRKGAIKTRCNLVAMFLMISLKVQSGGCGGGERGIELAG